MRTNPESVKSVLRLLIVIFPIAVIGQTFQVSGTIRDNRGEPVPYANVILLQVEDSTQIKGTSADENARFVLPDISPGLYYIQAKYFGYLSTPVPLDIRKDVRIGALLMEQDGVYLDEVVVTAKQPTIERMADRIVFNVENTIVAEGSGWDILRSAPGVISTQGQLEIRGQEVTVYLNDRKVQLSNEEVRDLLEDLPGNVVSSIEVIPNPPARYEAEGGPVINIITSKSITPGYKGSIQSTYEQAVFPKYSLGTSQFYKTEKWNIFGNYAFNPRKEFRDTDSQINFINEQDEVFARWDTDLDRITRSQAQQASLIVDYDLDDKNRFNFTANFTVSPNRTFENDLFTEMRNGQGILDSTLNTQSDIENDKTNLGLDLSYDRALKKPGESLKANVHYTYYDEDLQQEGSSDYFDPSGAFIRNFMFSTDARQKIDIITGQIDYETPIEKGKIEAGAKVSFIRSDSRIDYFDVNGTEPPFDLALSDEFRYEEDIYAAYLSLNKNWEKWSFKLGLRAEQTNVDARSVTLDSLNNQDYFELFPSFFLLHKVNENQSLSFDYSRKLRRPKYNDLNPFRYFLNENDFREGNPNLRPHFSHNFNLNYTINDTYFIDLYYRDNGNYISNLSFQDNENQTLREVRQNVLESISYGLDFTVGRNILPFWYLYSYFSLFYEEETFLALESEEETFTNDVTGVYLYMNNYLTISKDGSLKGEVAFNYLSGFLDGSFTLSERIILNLGLRKSLWNNKAVVSIVAEDLFKRANSRYTSRYLNQDNSNLPVPETRFFRVGLTVNFGNYDLSANRRNLRKSERDRL